MTNEDLIEKPSKPWAAILATVVSLAGIADAAYLTIHHYTNEPVPCSLIEGCEQVLTSSYATIGGIPLAIFGLLAYFAAFSLALLTVFGNRVMWKLFGAQVVIMAIFSAWLIYVQAAIIGAFCQFCLLSALITTTLLVIFIVSLFRRSKPAVAC